MEKRGKGGNMAKTQVTYFSSIQASAILFGASFITLIAVTGVITGGIGTNFAVNHSNDTNELNARISHINSTLSGDMTDLYNLMDGGYSFFERQLKDTNNNITDLRMELSNSNVTELENLVQSSTFDAVPNTIPLRNDHGESAFNGIFTPWVASEGEMELLSEGEMTMFGSEVYISSGYGDNFDGITIMTQSTLGSINIIANGAGPDSSVSILGGAYANLDAGNILFTNSGHDTRMYVGDSFIVDTGTGAYFEGGFGLAVGEMGQGLVIAVDESSSVKLKGSQSIYTESLDGNYYAEAHNGEMFMSASSGMEMSSPDILMEAEYRVILQTQNIGAEAQINTIANYSTIFLDTFGSYSDIYLNAFGIGSDISINANTYLGMSSGEGVSITTGGNLVIHATGTVDLDGGTLQSVGNIVTNNGTAQSFQVQAIPTHPTDVVNLAYMDSVVGSLTTFRSNCTGAWSAVYPFQYTFTRNSFTLSWGNMFNYSTDTGPISCQLPPGAAPVQGVKLTYAVFVCLSGGPSGCEDAPAIGNTYVHATFIEFYQTNNTDFPSGSYPNSVGVPASSITYHV